MLSSEFLIGKDDSQMVPVEKGSRVRVHEEVADSLSGLTEAAEEAGFALLVVSGFRGFDHQLRIWNEKALGKRMVNDEHGKPLPPPRSPEDHERRFFSMLRWSSFPGLSRHHWGSDMDVVDKKAMPAGYQVQLVPEEVEGAGLFAPFHDWLDNYLSTFHFFRPYAEDRGGVSPERWHLSYAPLAQRCQKDFLEATFKKLLAMPEIEYRNLALRHSRIIWDRYFQNVDFP